MNTISTIQSVDKTCLPWACNRAKNPDKNIKWVQYNHFDCFMIECYYQIYKAGDKTFKQIPIRGYFVIDFEYLV